jgi:hypothetical protein
VPDPLVAAVEGARRPPVRRDRMLRGSGRCPVWTRRCAWFGSSAQAYTVSALASARAARWATNSVRSGSSRKRVVRSIPRTITWWRPLVHRGDAWRSIAGMG